MEKNKKNFLKRDNVRFTQYLEEANSWMKDIASRAIQPQQIVKEMLSSMSTPYLNLLANNLDAHRIDVAERQWADCVHGLKESGVLSRALPVLYVSGAKKCAPVFALCLLTAAASDKPFRK